MRCCKRGPARSDSTELSETPPDHHYHSQQPNHHGNSVTLAPLKTQVKIDLNSPTSVVRPEVQLQQPPITPTSSDTQAVSSMISPRRKKNCQEQPELPDYPASLDISADLEFPASGERRLSAISISSAVSDTSDEMFSGTDEMGSRPTRHSC